MHPPQERSIRGFVLLIQMLFISIHIYEFLLVSVDSDMLRQAHEYEGVVTMIRVVSTVLLVAVIQVSAVNVPAWAADSAINQRLFDAVGTNDMAAVRRMIGQGADPFVANRQGLGAVDLAVDKGYFDIAHYLLAVQNRRFQGEENVIAPLTLDAPPAPRLVISSAPTIPVIIADPVPPLNTPAVPIAIERPKIRSVVAPQTIILTNEAPPADQESETVAAAVFEAPTVDAVEDKPMLQKLLGFFNPAAPKPEADASAAQGAKANSLIAPEPAPVTQDDASAAPPKSDDGEVVAARPDDETADDQPVLQKLLNIFSSTDPDVASSDAMTTAEILPAAKNDTVAQPKPDPLPQPEIGVSRAETADTAIPEPTTGFEKIINFLRGIPEHGNEVPSQPELLDATEGQIDVAQSRPKVNELPPVIVPPNDPSPAHATPQILPTSAKLASVDDAAFSREERIEDRPVIIDKKTVEGNKSTSSSVSVLNSSPAPQSSKPIVERASIFDHVSDFITSTLSPEKTETKSADAEFIVGEEDESPSSVKETASLSETITPEPPSSNTLTISQQESVLSTPMQAPAKKPTSGQLPSKSTMVLRADSMVLGEAGRLGKPRRDNADCVEKPAWHSSFCIEVIAWPDEIKPVFGGSTFYAGGGRVIVRYDANRATQYHALFPTASFRRLSTYFKRKFGAPSETPDIWTAMLGAPKRFNKTLRWRAPRKNGDGFVIVEIREIDDLRWSAPPDVKHGVVRLYQEGARSVFELLTTADLLLMQVRKGVHDRKLMPETPPNG